MVRREHVVSTTHETAGQTVCGGIGYPTSPASGSSAPGGIPNSARGLGPGKLAADDDGQAASLPRADQPNKQSKQRPMSWEEDQARVAEIKEQRRARRVAALPQAERERIVHTLTAHLRRPPTNAEILRLHRQLVRDAVDDDWTAF
jgi:hypothetical protein